jgi:hypothetical protein
MVWTNPQSLQEILIFRSNRFDEVFAQGGVECIRKRLLTIHVECKNR